MSIHERLSCTVKAGVEEEEVALEKQTEAYEEAEELGQELLAIATFYPQIISSKGRFTELRRMLQENPDKSCNHTLVNAPAVLGQLIYLIGISQVPQEHDIRMLIRDLRRRLDLLTLKNNTQSRTQIHLHQAYLLEAN